MRGCLFFLSREFGGSASGGLGLKPFAFRLCRLARQLRLSLLGGLGFTFRPALHHRRVVRTGLIAKLGQDVLSSLLRGFLSVGKARFFKSAHDRL